MGQHTRGPGTARLDRGNDSPMYRYPLGSARKVKGVSHAIRLGVGINLFRAVAVVYVAARKPRRKQTDRKAVTANFSRSRAISCYENPVTLRHSQHLRHLSHAPSAMPISRARKLCQGGGGFHRAFFYRLDVRTPPPPTPPLPEFNCRIFASVEIARLIFLYVICEPTSQPAR